MINQQKALKEHKSKQIRFVANEMRRKFSETIKKEGKIVKNPNFTKGAGWTKQEIKDLIDKIFLLI